MLFKTQKMPAGSTGSPVAMRCHELPSRNALQMLWNYAPGAAVSEAWLPGRAWLEMTNRCPVYLPLLALSSELSPRTGVLEGLTRSGRVPKGRAW